MRRWRPLLIFLGRLAYWLTWPATWAIVHGSKRTRVLVTCGDQLIVTKGWLSDGKWTLPGGGLHKGENSLDGALRGLFEETGLRLQPKQARRHPEQVYQAAGLSFNYVLFIGTARRRQTLRPQPWEIADARWLDRRELTADNAHDDVLTAIRARWRTKQ